MAINQLIKLQSYTLMILLLSYYWLRIVKMIVMLGGLPGGKQENDESILECAVRELEEETPYILYNLSGIHHLCDMPEFDYMVSVFIVDVKYLRPMISDNQEYNYAWLAPEFVLSGPFADFNERLFKIVFPKDE